MLIVESGSAGENNRLDVNFELIVFLGGHGKFSEVSRDFGVSDSRSGFSSHLCGCGWVSNFFVVVKVVVIVVEWLRKLRIGVEY